MYHVEERMQSEVREKANEASEIGIGRTDRAVDKGLRGRNILQSLLLILLRICSRSVRPILTSSNEPLQHQKLVYYCM